MLADECFQIGQHLRPNVVADLAEDGRFLFFGAGGFGGVGEADVGDAALAQPQRAVFGGVVADGDD